jgi:hypothetical protein
MTETCATCRWWTRDMGFVIPFAECKPPEMGTCTRLEPHEQAWIDWDGRRPVFRCKQSFACNQWEGKK